MKKEYKTVLKEASAEIEEKKSRFIAAVKPVSTEEEALDFISSLKGRYWDASHNVYAYYIGGNNIIQRFSDDGEPSGTAGMPVLEVIRRMGVENLAVVVTRYFGGTLLGASGLIRAYSKSASLGIEAAEVVRRVLCTEVSIVVEYGLYGKVQNLLISSGYAIKKIIFEQDVEIIVYIPADETERFAGLIEESSNARSVVGFGENVYVTLGDDGRIIDTSG